MNVNEICVRRRNIETRLALVGVSDFYNKEFADRAVDDIRALLEALDAALEEAKSIESEKDDAETERDDAEERAKELEAENSELKARVDKLTEEVVALRDRRPEQSPATPTYDAGLKLRIAALEAELEEAGRRTVPAERPTRRPTKRDRVVDTTVLFSPDILGACEPRNEAQAAPLLEAPTAPASANERVLAALSVKLQTIGEIAKTCGLPTKVCSKVLGPAAEAKRIHKEGERRATRYALRGAEQEAQA